MTATTPQARPADNDAEVLDVLVVGAGFSGLYQLDRHRDLGFTTKIWDAAGGLGGIWWWNCYPGARTDSTGQIYQFSHKDLWKDHNFSELYPDFAGVREYFEYVDARLDLTKDIVFDTFVEKAEWDESTLEWTVTAKDGKQQKARSVIVATGFGAKPLYPKIAGLETFRGECHHTARWPQGGLDMTGKKVVVVGTGASGVQVIQEAAAVAEQLTIFQRTPNLALPMRQRKLTDNDNEAFRQNLPKRFKTRYEAFAGFDFDFIPQNATEVPADERTGTYERMWAEGGFPLWLANYQDVLADVEANKTFYEFWRSKVHERVSDPATAELLAPATPPHPFGVKRPALEQNYFDVFNQDDVRLVDHNAVPIEQVVADGVITSEGLIECDIIVLATGFDNNRGGIMAIDIVGADGQRLQDKWAHRVDTYMGLSTAGFPNMLFLYGPQSPSGFCNGPTSAEYQGEIVVQFLQDLRERGLRRFESSDTAEKAWTAHVNELFEASLFTKARSWYWGANVPGKPAQMLNYTGGVPAYFSKWDAVRAAGYEGFNLS